MLWQQKRTLVFILYIDFAIENKTQSQQTNRHSVTGIFLLKSRHNHCLQETVFFHIDRKSSFDTLGSSS